MLSSLFNIIFRLLIAYRQMKGTGIFWFSVNILYFLLIILLYPSKGWYWRLCFCDTSWDMAGLASEMAFSMVSQTFSSPAPTWYFGDLPWTRLCTTERIDKVVGMSVAIEGTVQLQCQMLMVFLLVAPTWSEQVKGTNHNCVLCFFNVFWK